MKKLDSTQSKIECLTRIPYPHPCHVVSTQVCWVKLKDLGIQFTPAKDLVFISYFLFIYFSYLVRVSSSYQIFSNFFDGEKLFMELSHVSLDLLRGRVFRVMVNMLGFCLGTVSTKLYYFIASNLFDFSALLLNKWIYLN